MPARFGHRLAHGLGHRLGRAALLLAFLGAGCRDDAAPRADDASTEAGDVALAPSDADALAAIEHPVQITLGEAQFERLLTARERLASVQEPPATAALQLDVRDARLDPSGSPPGSIVEELQRSAHVRRAIEGSGLSVSEYVGGMFAVQQAVLASGVDARGALPPLLLANVQVVERNADRVAQLTEGTPFEDVVSAWAARDGTAVSDFSGLTTGAARPVGPAAARVTGSPSASSSDASRAARRDYDPRARDDDDRDDGDDGKRKKKRKRGRDRDN